MEFQKLSPIEVQEIKRRTRAMTYEEQKATIMALPTILLNEEWQRRELTASSLVKNMAEFIDALYGNENATLEDYESTIKCMHNLLKGGSKG